MPQTRQSITLDEVWEKISNDIEHLFQFQTIRYSKWMSVYTHIFDYCTNQHCNTADLYESFRNYLRNYLENLSQSIGDLHGQELVQYYITQWKKYRISSRILHGICSYLHRYYVPREHDSSNSNICEIYQMAMQFWQQVVARLYHEKIAEICLNMIKSERNRQKIDTEIIRNIIQTYMTFHIREHAGDYEDNSDLLDLYQEYFEDRFLEDTKDFYRLQASVYLQQHSVIEYLSKISEYFHDEIHRVTDYLHPSTIIKLIKNLEEVLIREQLPVIDSEAENCIRDEKIEEWHLLFQTVNRIDNGKIKLRNLLENHVYQIGIARINLNPTNVLKIYIQTIYDLHEKYFIFIQKAFENDQDFIDDLNRTFRKLVNHNMGNMAESLARYCDKLLRKGRRKEEIDLDAIFDQIKILLYYMQDKDIFEKFYSKLLAKRLIHQMSISSDYEKSMISTIQNACGFDYGHKMKQMCQDIETSEHILDQYSKTEQINPKIGFKILILNSNAWLLSIPSNVLLPNELQLICNQFTKFYKQIHSGRKLIWLHQHSKGELQTRLNEKVYTFQVSVYQMMILLLFNNSSELTIEKIHDQTQIQTDLLSQILIMLLQSKILICPQCIDQVNLDLNSVIKLSDNFISEKYCVNLNTSIKSIEENDRDVCQKRIHQDRTVVIQAAIVRIIKSHKTMNQNLLIQTVIEQLNSHFSPNITVIKECINTLIKREYLERPSYNPDILCYLT